MLLTSHKISKAKVLKDLEFSVCVCVYCFCICLPLSGDKYVVNLSADQTLSQRRDLDHTIS